MEHGTECSVGPPRRKPRARRHQLRRFARRRAALSYGRARPVLGKPLLAATVAQERRRAVSPSGVSRSAREQKAISATNLRRPSLFQVPPLPTTTRMTTTAAPRHTLYFMAPSLSQQHHQSHGGNLGANSSILLINLNGILLCSGHDITPSLIPSGVLSRAKMPTRPIVYKTPEIRSTAIVFVLGFEIGGTGGRERGKRRGERRRLIFA